MSSFLCLNLRILIVFSQSTNMVLELLNNMVLFEAINLTEKECKYAISVNFILNENI